MIYMARHPSESWDLFEFGTQHKEILAFAGMTKQSKGHTCI